MSGRRTKRALQAAFLHTVSSLYALYDELDASEELREATAEVLAGVISAHLLRAEAEVNAEVGMNADEQSLADLLCRIEDNSGGVTPTEKGDEP